MKFAERVSTALPKPLYDELQEYAARELVSPSTAVRQAVAFFLAAQARKTSAEAPEMGEKTCSQGEELRR